MRFSFTTYASFPVTWDQHQIFKPHSSPYSILISKFPLPHPQLSLRKEILPGSHLSSKFHKQCSHRLILLIALETLYTKLPDFKPRLFKVKFWIFWDRQLLELLFWSSSLRKYLSYIPRPLVRKFRIWKIRHNRF